MAKSRSKPDWSKPVAKPSHAKFANLTKLKQDFLGMSWLGRLWLLAPIVIWFSYLPRISLGGDATMNYELSIPLIYIAVLALVGLPTIWRGRRELLTNKYVWLATVFIIWTGLTVLWSPNLTRGVLTFGITGILYLIFLASYVQRVKLKWQLPTMVKLLIGSSVVACLLALGQMLIGTFNPAVWTAGLCPGCVAGQFGFVRPNLFAIEPQFVGSLLLAPALIMYRRLIISPRRRLSDVLIFILLATTLGLTLSRGAIYAFAIGVVVMWLVIKRHWLHKLMTVDLLIISAVLCLAIQGGLAAINPNISETFWGAVSKSVDHLSLGTIDLRSETTENSGSDVETAGIANDGVNETATTSLSGQIQKKPNYDGYVAESTDVRVNLSQTALKAWSSQSLAGRLFGTGLGSAGIELARQSGSDYQKEIVQNEFIEVLLERGTVGLLLLVALIVVTFRKLKYFRWSWAIVTAYLIQYCFFSGLPNALHVWMMLIWLTIL